MDTSTEPSGASRAMKRFVKAELKRADVTYEELARRLPRDGDRRNEGVGRSKSIAALFRLGFSVAAMKAIGREQVNLADV